MGVIGKIIKIITEIKVKYIFYGSYIRVEKGSNLSVGKNVKIKKTKIYIQGKSELKIAENVNIQRSIFHIYHNSKVDLQKNVSINHVKVTITGDLFVGSNSILTNGNSITALLLNVSSGKLNIANNAMIRCYRILVRFNGEVHIGAYTNINEGSEIRADEYVKIGSFNQISFNCMIWDTNTHNIYQHEKRQDLTIAEFPNFGYEYEKPKTKPVTIGNDCWIGRDATVMKGSNIGNCCVIGYRTTIIGESYPDNTTIVSCIENITYKNRI